MNRRSPVAAPVNVSVQRFLYRYVAVESLASPHVIVPSLAFLQLPDVSIIFILTVPEVKSVPSDIFTIGQASSAAEPLTSSAAYAGVININNIRIKIIMGLRPPRDFYKE